MGKEDVATEEELLEDHGLADDQSALGVDTLVHVVRSRLDDCEVTAGAASVEDCGVTAGAASVEDESRHDDTDEQGALGDDLLAHVVRSRLSAPIVLCARKEEEGTDSHTDEQGALGDDTLFHVVRSRLSAPDVLAAREEEEGSDKEQENDLKDETSLYVVMADESTESPTTSEDASLSLDSSHAETTEGIASSSSAAFHGSFASLPGAYCSAPRTGLVRRLSRTELLSSRQSSRSGLVSEEDSSFSDSDLDSSTESGLDDVEAPPPHDPSLVHAHPVDEDVDIEVATAVDASEDESSRQRRQKRCVEDAKSVGILVLLLSVLVLASCVIVLAVLIPHSNSTGRPQNATSTALSEQGGTVAWMDTLQSFTIDAIGDPTSPQFQAYLWVLNDPQWDFYANWRKQQRFALATLYMATNGDDWSINGKWLDYNEHECDWANLARLPPLSENPCNEEKELVALVLLHNNEMKGTIPPELSYLSTLQALVLGRANLLGTIPNELWELTGLKVLSLVGNQLTGTISAEALLQMKDLLFLDLALNLLTSSIPSEIGTVSLFHLGVTDNMISGPLPTEVGLMSGLVSIMLGNNRLSGTLPEEIFHDKPLLAHLELRRNRFEGTLPGSLIAFLPETLEYFEIQHNTIKGSIPPQIGALTGLNTLNLMFNELVGTVPSEIGLLSNKLEYLNLKHNLLTGTFPSATLQMYGLKELNLRGNPFEGAVPPEVWQLSNLEHFDLSGTNFSLSLPANIGMALPRMKEFGMLGTPYFTGTLPTSMELWTNLLVLEISHMNSVSKLPRGIWDIISLERMVLGPNITGSIPSDKSWPNLWHLQLAGSLISGTVPDSVCGIPELIMTCSKFLCGCDCPCNA